MTDGHSSQPQAPQPHAPREHNFDSAPDHPPASKRGTSIALVIVAVAVVAYAIFGGLTPMVVSGLLKVSPMGPAWYVAGICTIGLLVGIYLLAKKR